MQNHITLRFSYAILKLSKFASMWFERTQTERARLNKAEISTWTALKTKMRKRFVPRTYKQDLYMKLNSLEQNHLSVEQYIKEFERLSLACECKDEDEQKAAKFLIGLKNAIANQVELQHFYSFDEACQLAIKVERQLAEAKAKTPRSPFTPIAENSRPWDTPVSLGKGSNSTPPPPTSEPSSKKHMNLTPGQAAMREKQCFKC